MTTANLHHTLLALGAAAALAACSSAPIPREEMAVAKSSVERVGTSAGVLNNAPLELQSARDKLTRAQKAMDNKDYVQARRLAEQANVDAQLAEAKNTTARSQQAVQEVQNSVRELDSELQRRAPRN